MKMNDKRKALLVTDKQLTIIRDACELYGRIQLGQFRMFAEVITQTGFSGSGMRVNPKRKEGETDEQYNERCDRLYDRDGLVQDCIEGAVDGIYRHAYRWEGMTRTNEADIALDIWAVLDGRREDGFHMGSEPLVEIKEKVTDEDAR